MKNISIILILILYFNFGLTAQNKIISKRIFDIYKKMTISAGHVFVADTLLQHKFSFREIENEVTENNKKLLGLLLSKGVQLNISLDTLLSCLPDTIHKISVQEFENYQPPNISLTDNESNTLKAIDSIGKLRDRYNVKSSTFKLLMKKEQKLFSSTYFKTYWKKLGQYEKRLLILFPIIQYENYFLLAVSNFKSATNSFITVEIIKSN